MFLASFLNKVLAFCQVTLGEPLCSRFCKLSVTGFKAWMKFVKPLLILVLIFCFHFSDACQRSKLLPLTTHDLNFGCFLVKSDNLPFSTSSVSNLPSPVSSRQESHVDNFLPSPALIRQSESLRMSSYVTQKPCASFLTRRLNEQKLHRHLNILVDSVFLHHCATHFEEWKYQN